MMGQVDHAILPEIGPASEQPLLENRGDGTIRCTKRFPPSAPFFRPFRSVANK